MTDNVTWTALTRTYYMEDVLLQFNRSKGHGYSNLVCMEITPKDQVANCPTQIRQITPQNKKKDLKIEIYRQGLTVYTDVFKGAEFKNRLYFVLRLLCFSELGSIR